jgi:diacylglycerol kinase (ATP)
MATCARGWSFGAQTVKKFTLVRIGVLTNLRAGGSGARSAQVLEHLANYPDIVHVETDSADTAPDAVGELARAGVDILVVNGGDGTLARTLTEMLREGSPFPNGRLPIVAPLRTGRTSMTAYDIGSRRDSRVSIERLLQRVRENRIEQAMVKRAVLRMKLEPDGVDHWGTFFGVGVIYRGTLLTHKMFPKGRSQGAFGSTVVTAGLIAKALTGRGSDIVTPEDDPLTIDSLAVSLDDSPAERGDFQLLLATTLNRLFAGIRPFWGKGPGGIRYTALGPGCLKQPRDVARVLGGKEPRGLNAEEVTFDSRNVEKLELELDCGISLDGEMFAPVPGRRATLVADHRIRFLSTR